MRDLLSLLMITTSLLLDISIISVFVVIKGALMSLVVEKAFFMVSMIFLQQILGPSEVTSLVKVKLVTLQMQPNQSFRAALLNGF